MEIGENTGKLEGEVNDLSKSMEFANAEIEDLKKNDKENEVKIKELEDKIPFMFQKLSRKRPLRKFLKRPRPLFGPDIFFSFLFPVSDHLA